MDAEQSLFSDRLGSDAEEIALRFDQARQLSSARIEDFLACLSLDGPDGRLEHRRLLEELIEIDLEYGWREAGAEKQVGPLLETYLEPFPELALPDRLPLRLILWEYEVRHRYGDRPSHADYKTRFPSSFLELSPRLHDLDGELATENRNRDEQVRPIKTGLIGPTDTTVRVGPASDQPVGVPAPPLPRNFGPYQLMQRVGGGGGGEVYKAWHAKMDRWVAVKVLHAEMLNQPELVVRFYREIEAVGQLSHPHIVLAYDAGPADATHFLAMEFLDGTDLGRLVKEYGPLSLADAQSFIRQAASGLQYIHERGLVHRDIKPSNLLLVNNAKGQLTIKILDLGLARLLRRASGEPATAITRPNSTLMGTVDYLAPEQAVDSHQVDIRADIYSLGCTFFYLLTGQPPFPGGSETVKLMRHQFAPIPNVRTLRPDVPEGVALTIAKMLAKEPKERFQTPGEIERMMLNPSLLPLPRAEPRPEPSVTVAPLADFRRRRFALILVIVLGCLALAVGLWFLH
jgi:serine/threonine protein kinase